MTTNSASSGVVKWRRTMAVDAHLLKYVVVVLVTFFGRGGLVVGQDEITPSFQTTTVYQTQPEGGGTTTEQTVITEDVSSSQGHVGVSGGDSGTAPNIYRGQSVQSVLSSFGVRGGTNGAPVLGGLQQQYYPTVNKCCPFFSRYEAGECVQAQPNSSRMMTMMPNQPFWEAPKAMVTLLSKDLDGMEISNDTVVFRLRVSQPACGSERIERIIRHDLSEIHQQHHRHHGGDSGNLNATAAGQFEPTVVLTTDGMLIWLDEAGLENQVSYQDFCIDIVEENVFVAVLCTPACTERKPCIRKCCTQNSVLFNSTCMLSNRPWFPHLYSSPGQPVSSTEVGGLKMNYKIGRPRCEESYEVSLREEPDEKMYLLLNGTLVMESGNSKLYFEPDQYCLDGAGSHTVIFSDSSNPDYPDYPLEIAHFGGTEIDQVALICFSEDNILEDKDVWRLKLYASVDLISTFFLLLTAIVYVILWEHQNIHGWLQYSYVISLLCANIFLSVVQFAPDSLQQECLVCCRVMGSLIHFSYLSAFFWLTSMNFDLFWTFRYHRIIGCRPLRTSTNTGEKKRYLGFLLFSLGFPTLIAGAGLVLDSLYKDHPDLYVITPRFGERNCYFYGEKEKLPYFYGPVGLLLTINSVFFVCTIYSLHKLQNDTKFATRQSSRQEKKRFLLFMKLFVVMGVTWIFDVISWAAEQLNPEERHFIRKIFVPTDLLIALQGVAIFVIFTCKPNTCRQLEAQFKKFSLYLQEQRDKKTDGLSTFRVKFHQVIIWICLVIIPVVNRLRELMSFCCRATRTLEGGRRSLAHNSTLTSTWDKTRKASDCSVSTVVTHVDHHGSIEMDCASKPSSANSNPAATATTKFPSRKGNC